MKIFIDESGNFLRLTSAEHLVSCVSALVFPATGEASLFSEFLALRTAWGHAAEVKGSSPDERQVAAVIDLLRRHQAVSFVTVIDMADNTEEEVVLHQRAQAAKVVEHLSPEHNPEIAELIRALQDDTLALSPQLFVQARLMLKLIPDIIRYATLYYVQRLPVELSRFDWIIDAKDHDISRMEHVWTQMVMPAMEREFLHEPLVLLEDADYSHFDRLAQPDTDEDRRHQAWLESTRTRPAPAGLYVRPISIAMVMRESFAFRQSSDELGLQLADILASAFRRSLNGTLGPAGWKNLGGLLVRRTDGRKSLLVVNLSTVPKAERVWEGQIAGIAHAINGQAQPLLVTAPA